MKKFYYIVLSLILTCFLNSCSKDEKELIVEPDNPENPVPDNPDDPDTSDDIVSPDYVDIDWTKTKIQSQNLNSGEFTLVFDENEIPSFQDSLSIVVLQTDTSAYLRRIMDTQVNGKTVVLKTINATMEELFHDVEFTLSVGEDQTRLITSKGNTYTPSKIVQIYSDKSYNVVYDKTNTRNDYIEIDPSIPIPLYNMNLKGHSLNVIFGEENNSTSISIEAEEFIQSLTNTILLHFKFGSAVNEKEIGENFRVKISDVEEFSCKVRLDMQSLSKLKFSTSREYKIKKEVDLLTPLCKLYTFLIGPVPVFVTEHLNLLAALELGINETISVDFGYQLKGDCTLGIEYAKGKGMKPVQNHNFEALMFPWTLGDNVSLDSPSIYGKLSICPELLLDIYSSVGPTFGISPYIEGKLYTGHIIPQFYGWSNLLNTGVDLQLGGKVDFFDSDVFKAEINYTIPVAEKEIYKAPKYIKTLTPEDETKVEIGQPVKVDFLVTSALSPLFSKNEIEEPVAMALVHFQGTGNSQTSQKYAQTNMEGIAEIEWTPAEAGDTLIATILDQNGKELSKAIFTPEIEEEFTIVGRWWRTTVWMLPEPVQHPQREDSENYLEFFADGTFEMCYNPLQKIRGVDISDNVYEGGYATVFLWELRKGTYSYTGSELKTQTTFYHKIRNHWEYDIAGNVLPWYEELFSPPYELSTGKIKIINENMISICIIDNEHEDWQDYIRITEDFKPELLYVKPVAE